MSILFHPLEKNLINLAFFFFRRSIEPIPEQAAACRQTYDKLKVAYN